MWGVINFTSSLGGGNARTSTENLTEISMMDIDGDGKVDQVIQDITGKIYWKKNIIGTTGLLKKIILPQGGTYEIEYEGEYGTVDNPGFKYVMSKVIVSDGIGEILPEINIKNQNNNLEESAHKFIAEYKYSNAYYDRIEKDSYGFNKVEEKKSDGTYQVSTYSTDDTEYKYNLLGVLMKNQKYSGIEYGDNNELLSEMSIEYDKSEDVWVKPLVEKQEVFEKSSDSNCISYATEYEYDDDYNVIKLSQLENDIEKINAEFTYIDIDDKKIYGLPETIIVKSPSGEILRKRSGEYNDKGLLTSLKQYYNDDSELTSNIEYDDFGNTKITTLVQIDGLGTVLRTAKNGVYYHSGEGRKELGWNVNGQFVFDSKGRVIKEGMTYFVGTGKDRSKNLQRR